MPRSLTHAVFTVFAVLTCALPAAAEPLKVRGEAEIMSATVRYSGAEAQTAAGATTVAFRIRKAASLVCGGESPLVRSSPRFLTCRQAVIDRALRGLDAPLIANALGRTSATIAAR